jgi:hypothetical protein
MSPRLLRPLAAAVALAAFAADAPRASAEFVYLQYTGSAGNPAIDNNRLKAPAGPFFWKENELPPNASFPPPTSTFCLELNAGQQLPTTGETVEFKVYSLAQAPSPAAANAALIAELYGKHYQTAWDSNAYKSSGTTDPSIAFQIALWELMYDGQSNNLTSGAFALPTTGYQAAQDAQALLASLTKTGDASYFTSRFAGKELVALIAPSSDGKEPKDIQDQITMRPTAVVPAPPGLILAGIGMVTLIGRSRLRRKPARG